MKDGLVIFLIRVIILGVILLHFFAPCGFYSFASVKDVPVRCIEYYNK